MRRVVAGAAAVSFVGFALLQLNDPDPVRWIAIYLAAAAVCGSEAAGRGDRRACLLVAAIAVAWGVWWVASDQLGGPPMHYGPSWGPLAREGMRELLGLGFVAATLGALAVWRGESPGVAPG